MWPNPQFPVDLVVFTEEILNGNFIFWAVYIGKVWTCWWKQLLKIRGMIVSLLLILVLFIIYILYPITCWGTRLFLFARRMSSILVLKFILGLVAILKELWGKMQQKLGWIIFIKVSFFHNQHFANDQEHLTI